MADVSRRIRRDENTTHGQSKTRLYKVWTSMKQRCSNPNDKAYLDYGGREIKVCDEWQDFEPFHEWAMSTGYARDLEIDRIDNDGDYEPGNCRWVSRRDQLNNTRINRRIAFRGETKTVAEWARELGLNDRTLRTRLRIGWTVERAFTTPPKNPAANGY